MVGEGVDGAVVDESGGNGGSGNGVVLAVDAVEVAVGEEDVDNGVEGRLFATVDANG